MATPAPWFLRHYERLNFDELRSRIQLHSAALRGTSEPQQAIAEVLSWDALRSRLQTMQSYARIHHLLAAESETARARWEFWDSNAGNINEFETAFAIALLSCPQQRSLQAHFGEQIFRLAACRNVVFSDDAQPLFEEQARLVTRYHELTSRTVAEVAGVPYNVLKTRKLLGSANQQLRRKAWGIREAFCQAHAEELDHLFDQLVQVRHQLSEAASLPDYVHLAYRLTKRLGYSAEDVGEFLTGVEANFVPLARAIVLRRASLLGVRGLDVYDEDAPLTTDAPAVVSAPAEVLQTLAHVFHDTHPALAEFMATMTKRHLFELESRGGKTGLSQCEVLPDLRLPFIVAQMDGSPRDVWSLLHECGHAFQAHRARDAALIDYIWPTSEGAELAATGLTYLSMGQTSHFFGARAEAEEQREHERLLASAIRGALLDRFQHAVYSQPRLSPRERRELWADLERKYYPWRVYPAELAQQASGAGFLLIPHLFGWPFSGLDFALAIASIQFHRRAKTDRAQALSDYITMCDLGGRRSFPEQLEAANLDSPFQQSTLQSIAQYLANILEV